VFVPNYFFAKNQIFLEVVLRFSSFFMASTLEVIFFLICFELVARLNYVTKTLKLLRKMATINVNTPACKLILYAEDFSTLFKQNMWLKKGFRFFLLINVMRHFMFILAVAVSFLTLAAVVTHRWSLYPLLATQLFTTLFSRFALTIWKIRFDNFLFWSLGNYIFQFNKNIIIMDGFDFSV